MKTGKGHNYSNLLDIVLTDITLTVKKGFNQLSFALDAAQLAKMVTLISERIAAGTKPAATFEKQLGRIELHREQLLDAFEELFRCYNQMIQPTVRQSPIDKARLDMLAAIPDMKMLRQMCSLTLGEAADSYVLPQEKNDLIVATVAAMREPTVPSKADVD